MLRIHESNVMNKKKKKKKINAGVEVIDEGRYCKIVNRSTDTATARFSSVLAISKGAGDKMERKTESGVCEISNSEKVG